MTTTLLIDLDDALLTRIAELADACGRSRGETVRALIEQGLHVSPAPRKRDTRMTEHDVDVLSAAVAAFEGLPDDPWLAGANDAVGDGRLRVVR